MILLSPFPPGLGCFSSPPSFYGCCLSRDLLPPLVSFTMPPLILSMGTCWPRHRRFSSTRDIKFSTTLARTLPRIVGLWVCRPTVVPVNCLPDYLRNSGLEILVGLAAPSPTGTNFAGTAFMAAYLSPSPSGPPLAGESEGASLVGSSLVGPPTSSTSQFVGGNPAASAQTTASLPASSLGGAGVLEGPPLSGSGGPVFRWLVSTAPILWAFQFCK